MTLVETIVLGAMEELGQREGCILSLILSLFTPPGEGQRPSRILAQVEQPVPEPRNEGYHNSPQEMRTLLPSHAHFTWGGDRGPRGRRPLPKVPPGDNGLAGI